MSAVFYDDAPPAPPTPPRPAVGHPGQRSHRVRPLAGDPLADAAARVLSIPVRQVYAALWRVGLIEVIA